jgi:hypothetical protein
VLKCFQVGFELAAFVGERHPTILNTIGMGGRGGKGDGRRAHGHAKCSYHLDFQCHAYSSGANY